jgi:hypothetical protein
LSHGLTFFTGAEVVFCFPGGIVVPDLDLSFEDLVAGGPGEFVFTDVFLVVMM